MEAAAVKESYVTGKTSQGVELRANMVRMTRYLAVFEIFNPTLVLRTSEVINDFKIIVRDRTIYSGRAVVRSLMNTGLAAICEVTLNESSWSDVDVGSEMIHNGHFAQDFNTFMNDWQKLYKILPEFKVVIADMQSFLSDLKLWLDQVELSLRASATENQAALETHIIQQLQVSAVPVVNELFERFESVSKKVDEELRPAHVAFGKRQLHPLLLCSPFVYRTFAKPLGYAGDYEMVNMMFRDPCEGGSLFAKVVNAYSLQLPPIVAHRNRITYLTEKLIEETWRGIRNKRTTRIFNLGCGPAHEIQQFFAKSAHCDHAEFTLADFNEETLARVNTNLSDIKRRYGHRTPIHCIKKTAHQIIKHSDKKVQLPKDEQYDFVYCAGLFDYLSDRVCRKLMDAFYDMVAPGGLLVATNVDVHPSVNEMEYFLEWHLIHRNTEQMSTLKPEKADPDNVKLIRDATGVNIFIEVRKDAGER